MRAGADVLVRGAGRHLRVAGQSPRRGDPGPGLHRRGQRAAAIRDHADSNEECAHPPGVPDTSLGSGRGGRGDRHRDRRDRDGYDMAGERSAPVDVHLRHRGNAVRFLRLAFRGRQRSAHRSGGGRRLPGPQRARPSQGGSSVSGSLDSYLVLSGLLFAIGSFGFLARRNAISMLMSIELMVNAVNLSVVAFGAFGPKLQTHAAVIALIVIAVAAAEATVGLAIVIAIYRNKKTPLVDEYDSMSQ